MSKQPRKKLGLSRETVRKLKTETLALVVGGGYTQLCETAHTCNNNSHTPSGC